MIGNGGKTTRTKHSGQLNNFQGSLLTIPERPELKTRRRSTRIGAPKDKLMSVPINFLHQRNLTGSALSSDSGKKNLSRRFSRGDSIPGFTKVEPKIDLKALNSSSGTPEKANEETKLEPRTKM